MEKDSFMSVTCVGGDGTINGEKLSLGDTYFIPAGEGEITVQGNLEFITVTLPKS